MRHYVIYLIYKFCEAIFKITPCFIIKYFLVFLSKLLAFFNIKHKKIVRTNLDIAFSNSLNKNQKSKILYDSYKSLVFNMFEFMENQYLSKERILSKVNLVNGQVIQDAINNNRKIIFMTAHYGGWEIALPYIGLKFGRVAVVNKKMSNIYMQRVYEKGRDNNNIIMIEKGVAAKGMIKAFKDGHHVAVVIDQHIGTGVEIDFFNQKVMATDSTSRLALKFDALIIPVFAVINDFKNYTIKINEGIDVKNFDFKTEDKVQELTQFQNSLIEAQIRLKPEQWFWQHKRFKHQHSMLY